MYEIPPVKAVSALVAYRVLPISTYLQGSRFLSHRAGVILLAGELKIESHQSRESNPHT